ncbi:transcriptional regulatory protein ZraR [bacterium BMS3Abin05]|nr:transcriptional regulatory protein ZraR [bacterium BMS3Abin05]HDZ11952.1 sigma-54-dependent Fis family transcriptional regulator [Bacteroidota bacterium]
MTRILIIDDDESLCRVIAHQLKQMGFRVEIALSGEEGLRKFKSGDHEVILSDINMPGMTGMEVLREVRKIDKNIIFIIITAYGSVDGAVEASKIGADDYLIKPFGKEAMRFVIEKALQFRQLRQENRRLKMEVSTKFGFERLVGRSPVMETLIQMATRVALSDSTVFIFGESGTGKELLARAIHVNSPRKNGPFVTVNCPSIPEQLIESELFGHVKGAFTGAMKDRQGKFEMANGGTLFLDEIGDLKVDLQAKLLRVLQEREIERVGENRPISVDVRIVAATNKNLDQMVAEGSFREDLYYRLRVLPIEIPPLRERREDIVPLVHHFIQKHGNGVKYKIDPDVLTFLEAYDWPGNVRELENVIERVIVLSPDQRISSNLLAQEVRTGKGTRAFSAVPRETLPEIEKQAIENALQKSHGNKTRAAEFLGIPRHVLLYRMKKYEVGVNVK